MRSRLISPSYTPVGYLKQEKRRSQESRRHLAAAFRTATASFDAILHIAEFFAALSASLADFGAKAAHGFMLFRADQHEIGGRLATLGASQHEPEVQRLHMLSARDETMMGGHAETNRVASQALLHASFHF